MTTQYLKIPNYLREKLEEEGQLYFCSPILNQPPIENTDCITAHEWVQNPITLKYSFYRKRGFYWLEKHTPYTQRGCFPKSACLVPPSLKQGSPFYIDDVQPKKVCNITDKDLLHKLGFRSVSHFKYWWDITKNNVLRKNKFPYETSWAWVYKLKYYSQEKEREKWTVITDNEAHEYFVRLDDYNDALHYFDTCNSMMDAWHENPDLEYPDIDNVPKNFELIPINGRYCFENPEII